MIVDSSAIVAILRGKPEAQRFTLAIEQSRTVRVSAATYVEVGAIMDRERDPIVSRRVDQLLDIAEAVIEPVTPEQARIARAA